MRCDEQKRKQEALYLTQRREGSHGPQGIAAGCCSDAHFAVAVCRALPDCWSLLCPAVGAGFGGRGPTSHIR